MQATPKTFLFDRDNLRQIFGDRRHKELLEQHGYKTIADLSRALIAQKALWAEYIIGLPGTGKTTFALNCTWAQAIKTKEDIHNLLTMQFDNMVFVTCDIEEEIAQQAEQITLLHTSAERVKLQRQERDDAIRQWISETAFWRTAGSVAQVTTDDSIMVSRLKTDYAEKSRIVVYTSNTPNNRDDKVDIPVHNLSEKKKYTEAGVVAASGKWMPAQIVHIEHQLKKVLALSQEQWLTAFAIIGQNAWCDYDLGLTQSERIKIINLELGWSLPFLPSGAITFIKTMQGKIIKIVPEQSWAVVGKDRLPAWFTSWSYQELVEKYPDFMTHKNAYTVKAFAGYNFINMGNVLMEWSDESISATFVRKCLVEGNVDDIKPYLSPAIFSVLTLPHNLRAFQQRYTLIQERDQKIAEAKDEITKKYKQINPLTQQPLLTKKWTPTLLSKKHADQCDNRRDQAKIMTYLHSIDQMIKDWERSIKKKYNKLIYGGENVLQLEVSN